jgi:hypothetical protein
MSENIFSSASAYAKEKEKKHRQTINIWTRILGSRWVVEGGRKINRFSIHEEGEWSDSHIKEKKSGKDFRSKAM